jgi:hypothetical protein
MTLLAGLHDREGAHLVPAGGWCLDTVALGENPVAPNYGALAPGVNWIVRLNWGYGSTGTLPPGGGYAAFAQRCASYARASSGCHRWVIGNESNLPREWPNGRPITPALYSGFYLWAREHIRQQPGHEQDEVLLAAPGPWNAEYLYADNPSGDWLVYFDQMIRLVHTQVDGFAIHAYTHGYDPALVTSDAKMDPPFADRHYHFRTYRDFLGRIPANLAHLPVYLTEANGDGPWQATGLMPAMLREIADWNAQQRRQINAVIFFRFNAYAGQPWGIADKPDVVLEFQQAAPHFAGPRKSAQKYSEPAHKVNLPKLETPVARPEVKRIWDMRLTQRGVAIQTPAAHDTLWTVTMGRWEDEKEAGGRHHIFVETVDEAGKRVVGLPLLVSWPGGSARIVTEAKPGEAWAGNFNMTAGEFSIRVDDGNPSEMVTGIQMGQMMPGGWNANMHTATYLRFERRKVHVASQTPVVPPVSPPAPALELGSATRVQGLLDPLVLEALIQVESGGEGFYQNVLAKIRVEAHLLIHPDYGNREALSPYFAPGNSWQEAYYRTAPDGEMRQYHIGQDGEQAAFAVAARIDEDAAIRCTSWGLGQVMGFHWQRLGYASPRAMMKAMHRSEAAQLVAMVNYILSTKGLAEAINAKDWDTITRLYNGVGLEHVYTPRLKAAYALLSGT